MRTDEASQGGALRENADPPVRCAPIVPALIGAWMALLVGAGLNAGWLFSALMKAGLQFRSGEIGALDSEETGRLMAGVLAQPAFLAVFVLGLMVGPFCAWMLMRQARRAGGSGRRMRWAAVCLVVAGGIGAGQLWFARTIADRAVERTEALVSNDQARASAVRAALDSAHRASEGVYAVQTGLVAAAALILAPRSRG